MNQRTYYYVQPADDGSAMPSVRYGWAIRSTDNGASWSPEISNLDGPWSAQSSMFPKGEPMQALELSPFEVSHGRCCHFDAGSHISHR